MNFSTKIPILSSEIINDHFQYISIAIFHRNSWYLTQGCNGNLLGDVHRAMCRSLNKISFLIEFVRSVFLNTAFIKLAARVITQTKNEMGVSYDGIAYLNFIMDKLHANFNPSFCCIFIPIRSFFSHFP